MLWGIMAVVAASFLFGVIPSANKYVLLSGMTSDCIVFYMALTMAVGSAAIVMVRHLPVRVRRGEALEMMVLGIVGMGLTDYLLAQAYLFLPVSMVTMLHFLYPALILGISVTVLGERFTRLKGAAAFLSVAGLVLISGPLGELKFSGIFYAVASAATYAFFVMGNEGKRIAHIPLIVKMLYLSMGGSLFFGVKTILSGNLSLPVRVDVAFVLLGIVGCGSLLAFYLITVGVRKIGAERVGFLNMLEPVISVFVSMLVYQDKLDLRMWMGCAAIIGSVLVITLDGGKV